MECSALQANLDRVRERIASAAQRAGRSAAEVRLVVITKTHPPETIRALYACGVREIGENRVHEALDKQQALADVADVCWHMVGHVQRRKARHVVGRFALVHSVDSVRLARELDKRAHMAGVDHVDVLLEVNVSGEATKYGFPVISPDHVGPFLDEVRAILELPHIRVHGLMTLAPLVADPEEARPHFVALRRLRDQLVREFPEANWRELSMGMSNDFEVAVEEGATLVRIGTAILGPRSL
ncbi:MAG: YggS family pyridoxal phosphate-dependent enzyme [Ardenticatenia bacterium]|nr:YggS family pyridoxal phosphate-dependent enzyme [Ardenticatenia bacterium]